MGNFGVIGAPADNFQPRKIRQKIRKRIILKYFYFEILIFIKILFFKKV